MNYGAILGRLTVENEKGSIGALNVAGDVVGIGQRLVNVHA